MQMDDKILNPIFRDDMSRDEVEECLVKNCVPLALAMQAAARAEDFRSAAHLGALELRWMNACLASLNKRLGEAYEKIAKLETAEWSSQ